MLDVLMRVDELDVHLEIMGDLPILEVHPVCAQQKAIEQISVSFPVRRQHNKWDCVRARVRVHASGVYIRFPDSSIKRPDTLLFCRAVRRARGQDRDRARGSRVSCPHRLHSQKP